MSKPIVTLTTDFGLSDHFVGVMKGVILGICREAEIVDITHQVKQYEVLEGAYVIAQVYPYFPKKTVHVVVVDPGVGSARRPILVEAAGQYFVGPDNGVLSMVYAREKSRVREITAEKFWLTPVSKTFHGRDVFAPCAAHLAISGAPARFGKLIVDHLRLGLQKPPRTSKRAWTGTILKIDHFGNLVTNFHVDDFPEIRQRPFEMIVGIQRIHRLAPAYADLAPGEACVIEGSSGYLEVSLNQSSAAQALGCGTGAPVELTLY
ncbi:MAG TPA: SAM-dependent chlorinase/fluorinase [Bryobacteraceae bacterium]|nr:SAM-dependent chlorinase/fluorinase [Bryobacteraceae bacterium]